MTVFWVSTKIPHNPVLQLGNLEFSNLSGCGRILGKSWLIALPNSYVCLQSEEGKHIARISIKTCTRVEKQCLVITGEKLTTIQYP